MTKCMWDTASTCFAYTSVYRYVYKCRQVFPGMRLGLIFMTSHLEVLWKPAVGQ